MNSRFSITVIYILLSISSLAASLADKDLRVISSSNQSLVVEYTPHYIDTSKISIGNQQFIKVGLFNGDIPSSTEVGTAASPVRFIPVGVPSEFGNTIEIVESSFKEIEGRLAPRAKMVNKNGISALEYVISDNYYKQQSVNEIVSFGDYGQLRGIPVQSVKVSPVDFDISNGKVKLYTKIVFRINYSPKRPSGSLQVQTDDLLKDALINYEVAKVWSVEKRRSSLDKTALGKATDKFNSLLSQGKWYRFEAPEEGIYKITPEMLTSLGLNPQTIDPKTIKIYNNGGKAVSEVVGTKRAVDLEENAVYLSKQVDDGKFNTGDYILFYGRGIHFFDYDTTGGKRVVKRYYHPYSKTNYFFLTYGGNQQKTMSGKQSLSSTGPLVQQSTLAYASWEEDKAKILNSGRRYMGDFFADNQKSRSYMTNLSGFIAGSKITYRFDFVNRSEAYASLKVEENSSGSPTTIYDGVIEGLGYGNLDAPDGNRGIERLASASIQPNIQADNSILRFTYTPNSSPSIGYMNYFEIYYQKQLKANSDQLIFYSPDSTTTVEYHLSNFSNTDIKVFDVTDYKNLKIVTGAKASGGDLQFQSSEVRLSGSKYLAIGAGAVKSPSNFAEVTNSNLHGMTDEGKFIIITHRNFLEQAKRLKSYKESQQKISTVVVDVQDIFNEFSCGVQDVSAIRDFIKYAYDNWAVRPEYVLLFGDGDYDYKDVEGKHQNFIIPYETENSLNNIDSYTADDFYTWVSGNDKVVDLAIGRINVTTVQEAQSSVDKIIKYETGSDVGPWRNLITLVADDANTSSEWEGNYHNVQSEDLSNNMIPASFDQKKIYEAMYPLVETSSGRRRPQVNQAIIDAINSGTLILNWIGHGNPDVWAHEYVFEKTVTIPQLVNDKYCFLTAATCDFGRWDTPGEQSSTELMVLKPDGGIIGAFSSARTVYANENAALNNVFYTYLLAPDTAGLTKTLGRTFMLTKIVRHETNDLKYHLFGDPTMRLLVPQTPVAIDSINGVASGNVNVKALSKLRISGSVRNSDKTVATGTNGECIMTVFDSERLVPVSELGGMQITLQGGTIYRGRVSISGGRFTTDFIVPKDISYQNEKGKVEAYVHSGTSDGIGYSKNIIVGGTDTTSHDDKKGPDLTIAFDQPDGDNLLLVKPTFNMYVKLKDQTGLNLTGTGIGHRLEAVLNGNESQPIDLTGEYTGDLDSGGKSGVAVHQFSNLQAGNYKVRVKAWDVFNNSTETEKSFTVSQTEGLVIKDVYNYPNPFKDQTTFTFQHNFSEPLDVKIKIYTVAGRMIRQIENPQVTDRFVKVFWDGKDQDGNMIANGTYLYKLIVRTISDSNSQEVLGKLAVIR